jgi:hypothetical protein
MSAELAQLADQVTAGLAQCWPAVSAAAGGTAAAVLQRIGDRAAEATGDAAVGWVGRVLTRVFARKPASPSDTPRSQATSLGALSGSASDGSAGDDAVVLDAEVLETLDDLAADSQSRSVRRLLTRYILDQAARDPELVDVLRELVAQAPEATVGSVGTSGPVTQTNTSGVTIANTGVARDIQAHGSGG